MEKVEEGTLLRDSEGYIRLPDLTFTTEEIKELVETLYLKCKLNCKVQQLNETFKEYDGLRGIKGPKSSKKWTDEEKGYVLEHVDDTEEMIGEALGRSGMSIFMAQSHLQKAYGQWENEHPEHAGLTRAERVKKYISRGE